MGKVAQNLRPMDNSEGSLSWALSRFQGDALTQLLDDLVRREDKGLKNNQCKQVKKSLAYVTNACCAIPDGGFLRKPVFTYLEALAAEYENWNDKRTGPDPEAVAHRMESLKKMRRLRQKCAKKFRITQHLLDNGLDLMLIDSVYGAFATLCNNVPEIFFGLSKAVHRYHRVRPVEPVLEKRAHPHGGSDDDSGDDT